MNDEAQRIAEATNSTTPAGCTNAVISRRVFQSVSFAAAQSLCLHGLATEAGTIVLKTLTLDEVNGAISNDAWRIVDTRSSDAYNGWKQDGHRRGGHLPGAVDFPSLWLECRHPDKQRILKAALLSKGIVPTQNVLLYGNRADEIERVAVFLREAGVTRLAKFDFSAWASERNRPLRRYKNYQLIVPPFIVKDLLDGKQPETFANAKRIKFAETSWGDENASYSKGHVPRSFHVNTDHFEPPPTWKLGSPEVLEQFASKYGFQWDDTVIVSGADPTAAYRLAIVLRYMGVADVRVLNGGFDAWKAAGYRVEIKSTPPPQAATFGKSIPQRPDLIDEIDDVRARLKTPRTFQLIDTRSWAEFTGKTSGYSYHRHKGRIAGSVYGQGQFKGKNSLTPYRNIDNTMRNADEIRRLWQQSKIDTEKHLSFFCGGGWRAAEVLTFAQVMGLEKCSLFSDGWIGWSNAQ